MSDEPNKVEEQDEEVQGHMRRGAEEPGARRLNEDDDDNTPDVEGHSRRT